MPLIIIISSKWSVFEIGVFSFNFWFEIPTVLLKVKNGLKKMDLKIKTQTYK